MVRGREPAFFLTMLNTLKSQAHQGVSLTLGLIGLGRFLNLSEPQFPLL